MSTPDPELLELARELLPKIMGLQRTAGSSAVTDVPTDKQYWDGYEAIMRGENGDIPFTTSRNILTVILSRFASSPEVREYLKRKAER